MKKGDNIEDIRKERKKRLLLTGGLTALAAVSAQNTQAQEAKTQDRTPNNITQSSYKTLQNDYLNSNAEKLFDMYRLAFNNDTRFNMVAEKEKAKCQTFFNKHPDLKRKCNEVDARLKSNRGLQGFNNAELIYQREGDNNLRAEILSTLANNTEALAEMNKINTNMTEISATEQQAAHIWSMYVAVETNKAPQTYQKFFDKYPQLYENCATAADKAGITKEILPITTITDPNAELLLNGSESLTETLSQTMSDYESSGKTIKIPLSTYQVTAADFSR